MKIFKTIVLTLVTLGIVNVNLGQKLGINTLTKKEIKQG